MGKALCAPGRCAADPCLHGSTLFTGGRSMRTSEELCDWLIHSCWKHDLDLLLS